MLKSYATLKAARHSLRIQFVLLCLCVVSIFLIGRIISKNVLDMDLIIGHDAFDPDNKDLVLQWDKQDETGNASSDAPPPSTDQEGFPVHSMNLVDVTDDELSTKAVHLSMVPRQPGDYGMSVLDRDGHVLATDSIHVDSFGTAFSWSTGAFTGDEALIAASIVFFAGLLAISLIHIIKLKGPLLCSYDSILSVGILLFSSVALLENLPMYYHHLKAPAFYPGWQLLMDIAGSGKSFVLLTYPLIVVFSLLLIISNIALLRHERANIRNLLGLLLGILMIGAGLGFLLYNQRFIQGSYEEYKLITCVENVLGIVLTYVECVLLSSMICAFRAARHVPERNVDYILILGCGFRKDGSLPPLLRGRVDKALEFWHRQKKETGKEAILMPSGGQGPDECMPEAEAMFRYIQGTGFPEESVVMEDRSRNTYQNMSFSRKIIKEREPGHEVKTAFVTTNYHVFRSGVWAGLAGLRAEGIGSKTKWWFWPNAFVRECAGLLLNRIVPELILLILITVFVALVSYFAV